MRAPFKAGYPDGSGPECILDADGKAVAVTRWGCDCCSPSTKPEHYEAAARIVAALNQAARVEKLTAGLTEIGKTSCVFDFSRDDDKPVFPDECGGARLGRKCSACVANQALR